MATAESLAKRGEFTANQLFYSDVSATLSPQQDEVISSYEPLQPVLAAILARFALLVPHFGLLHTTMLLNCAITAALAIVTALVVMELGYGAPTVILSALIVGLCTIAVPYSKQLFREPLAGLMLMTAALFQVRMLRRSSLGEALPSLIALFAAYGAKESNLMVLPVFALVFVAAALTMPSQHAKARRIVLISLATILAFTGVIVLLAGRADLAGFTGRTIGGIRTLPDRLLDLGTSGVALLGLLLSPGKGFLVFTPIALATIWAFPRFFRAHRRESILFGGVCLSLWFGYAVTKNDIWWGGLGWGPRFLVPLAGFVVVPIAPLLSDIWGGGLPRARIAFGAILLLSLYVQFLGGATDILAYQTAIMESGIQNRSLNSIWNPIYSPPIWILQFLTPDNWDFAWARYWGRGGGIDWLVLGIPLLLLGASSYALWRSFRNGIGNTPRAVKGVWLTALSAFCIAAAGIVYLVYDDPRLDGGDDRLFLLETVKQQGRSTDVLILYNHRLAQFVMNYSKSNMAWYSLRAESELSDAAQLLVDRLAGRYQRVWLFMDYLPGARAPHAMEDYLAATLYPIYSQTFSKYARLALYATPSAPSSIPTARRIGVRFGDRIELVGFDLSETKTGSYTRGNSLKLSLLWLPQDSISEDYTVFVQLLTEDGRVAWQTDRQPANGTRPTSSWVAGIAIRDNYALEVPDNWANGRYRLIVGMYQWPSIKRLPVSGKSESPTDFVQLDMIDIQ